MPEENELIEIPYYLNDLEYPPVKEHFDKLGIYYKSMPVTRSSTRNSRDNGWAFFVPETHLRAASIVFRNVLGIDDPTSLEPLVGDCPACGEQVSGAWTCPSCEISFRGWFDEDSPIVVFIRQHGGFDDR